MPLVTAEQEKDTAIRFVLCRYIRSFPPVPESLVDLHNVSFCFPCVSQFDFLGNMPLDKLLKCLVGDTGFEPVTR